MFHTFSVVSAAPQGAGERAPTGNNSSTKRQKISRACDRCRTFRTKCGEEKPCSRCVLDGVRCKSTSSSPAAPKPKSKIFGVPRYDKMTGEHMIDRSVMLTFGEKRVWIGHATFRQRSE